MSQNIVFSKVVLAGTGLKIEVRDNSITPSRYATVEQLDTLRVELVELTSSITDDLAVEYTESGSFTYPTTRAVNSALAQFTESITTLDTTVSELTSSITTLDATVSELTSSITALDATVSAVYNTRLYCLDISNFGTANYLQDEKVKCVMFTQGEHTFYSKALYSGGRYFVFEMEGSEGQQVFEIFGPGRRFRGFLFVGVGASDFAVPSSPEKLYPVDSDLYKQLFDCVKESMTNVKIDELEARIAALEQKSQR